MGQKSEAVGLFWGRVLPSFLSWCTWCTIRCTKNNFGAPINNLQVSRLRAIGALSAPIHARVRVGKKVSSCFFEEWPANYSFKFLKLSILAQRRRVYYVFAEVSIVEKSSQRRPERSHPPKTPHSKASLLTALRVIVY